MSLDQGFFYLLRSFVDENDISYNYYIMESSPIIEEYKCHISKPITISFMSPKKSVSNNSHLIKKYINNK